MTDQNKKSLRQFQCRDYLWEIFEQMSGELECSVDYLINEAMRQYARSRNYGASPGSGATGRQSDPTGPTRLPTPGPAPAAVGGPGSIAGMPQPAPVAGARARIPSQPSIPSAPPPPQPRAGGFPPPQQSGYGAPPQSGYGAPAPQPQQGQYGGQQGGYGAPAPQPSYGAPAPQPAYPAPPSRSSPGGYPAPPAQPQAYGGYPPPPQPQGFGAPQGAGYPAPPARSSFPPPPTHRPPSMSNPGAPPPLPGGGPAPQYAGAAPRTHADGMPTLFVIFNGQKYPVNKEEFIIGRGAKTADLPIKDGNISRRHAAIIFQSGAFYMKDLGSTNGVEYQGRRVDGRQIQEGDVYQLCDYELRFTYR